MGAEEKVCMNCLWWDIEYPQEKFRDCLHSKISAEEDGDFFEDGIQSFEGEYGISVFRSGPFFGCVHWEQKKMQFEGKVA